MTSHYITHTWVFQAKKMMGIIIVGPNHTTVFIPYSFLYYMDAVVLLFLKCSVIFLLRVATFFKESFHGQEFGSRIH